MVATFIHRVFGGGFWWLTGNTKHSLLLYKSYINLKFYWSESALIPKASWCLLAFNLRSAMLEDLTDKSSDWPPFDPLLAASASSEDEFPDFPCSMLLLFDKFRGKMDRGSVKDVGLEVLGDISEEGGCGGVPAPAGGSPKSVLTSSELLNPDKNGLKLPPNAATTAAYCK